MNSIYPLSRYIKITQIYHPQHLGVDFGWNDGPYCNQPIVAIEDGVVDSCVDGYGNTYPNTKIYGNSVILSHGDGYWSVYAHLLKGLTVKKGQKVRKGQVVGYMGNSGYSNGQHLHFELRKGENLKRCSIDPLDYLFVEDRGIYVNPSSKQIDRIRYKKTTVGTPVSRDPSKDQVDVLATSLNGRSMGSLDGEKLGYVTPGFYNIHDVAVGNGFTWYEIEKGLWCASKEGDWTVFYPKQEVKKYSVLFPEVTIGDAEMLKKVSEEYSLKIEVNQL